MTLPSAVSDRLILMPSCSRSPGGGGGGDSGCTSSAATHASIAAQQQLLPTCRARLALAFAASEVNQVQLADADVAATIVSGT